MPTRLYLVCHGDTTWTEQKLTLLNDVNHCAPRAEPEMPNIV